MNKKLKWGLVAFGALFVVGQLVAIAAPDDRIIHDTRTVTKYVVEKKTVKVPTYPEVCIKLSDTVTALDSAAVELASIPDQVITIISDIRKATAFDDNKALVKLSDRLTDYSDEADELTREVVDLRRIRGTRAKECQTALRDR